MSPKDLKSGSRPPYDQAMIDLEISEGVAFITLNAPATRNALNHELADAFVAARDAADRRRSGGTLPPGSRERLPVLSLP